MPELTPTASDRMNLVSFIFLFAVGGAGLGLVLGGFIKDAYGFQIAGVIFAVAALVFRYISLAAVWQHAPRDTPPAQVYFWRGIKDTLQNSQFICY